MPTEIGQLVRRFTENVQEARPQGYLLQGSVVRRHLVRPSSAGDKRYGPYYLWTRKMAGKTVTMALAKPQAAIIREAIARQRQLDRRLAALRSLSEQIILAVTDGVSVRNRAKSAR